MYSSYIILSGLRLYYTSTNYTFPPRPPTGETVVEYEGPRPAQGTGRHRVVVLVYEQQSGLHPTHPHLPPSARSCQVSVFLSHIR